ncbi:MAG TPA: hypothetical protein DHV48_20245 [Prolixibacteraceae bacterium]|nr:hypothetical protein [Prolixibacteraceae bacterium]
MTDADKNKIIGEAKGLISAIFQACENCDPTELTATYMNSPDFVSLINGVCDDYEHTVEKYPKLMSDFISQKATIISEKYVVLDAQTVFYTSISKWDCKLKNDSIAVFEPVGLQFLLKKVDNQWKVLSWTEAYQL